MTTAEQAKAEGMTRADHGATFAWKDECRRAIERAAATGEEFQTYDLVRRFGCSEPEKHQAWGKQMQDAEAAGLIEWVRYEKSERPSSHRSVLSVWRGAA